MSLVDADHPMQQTEEAKRIRQVRRNSWIGGGTNAQDDDIPAGDLTGVVPGGKRAEKCGVWWGSASRPGNDPLKKRKENQDCFIIEDCFAEVQDAMVFGVFDGHGPNGAQSSLFVRDKLLEEYIGRKTQLLSQDEATVNQALVESAVACDVLLNAAPFDTYVSGTSGCMCFLHGSTLSIANVGDSRAIMGIRVNGRSPEATTRPGIVGRNSVSRPSQSLVTLELSNDQRAQREDEAARIIDAGGRVFEWGVPRVWLKEVDMPGLAMTRSFGDQAASSVGVIAVPEMHTIELTEDDVFLVLATDGLWEFVDSEDCVQKVAKCLEQQKGDGSGDNTNGGGTMDPQQVCDELVQEAVQKWEEHERVVDDITVLVVYFTDAMAVNKSTGRSKVLKVASSSSSGAVLPAMP
jgi:serine/threonine protein phosphatase PrpC